MKAGLAAAAAGCAWGESDPAWGGPVLDTHLHLRRDADACFTHMQGCGVTHAVLLTGIADQDRAKQEMEKRPKRFARSVTGDPAQPDAARQFGTRLARDVFAGRAHAPSPRQAPGGGWPST